MKLLVKIFPLILCLTLFHSCFYGVNSETSEIGDLPLKCIYKSTLDTLAKIYAPENLKDSVLAHRAESVTNHFSRPKYLLCFENPNEIIGCDDYSIRAVYNAEIENEVLDGLSPVLSDIEQVRIRNRVIKVLMKYQCKEGKLESKKLMKEPAPFSKE